MRSKQQRELIAMLKATGRAWEIVDGTKHKKIFLEGRFIGVIPLNPKDGKDLKNIVSAIKRALQ